MRRYLLLVLLMTGLIQSATFADGPARRKIRLGSAAAADLKAPDLTRPEGKTRWDLSGLTHPQTWIRTVEEKDGAVIYLDERSDSPKTATASKDRSGSDSAPARIRFVDPAGGPAAVEWSLPESNPAQLRMGSVRSLVVDEETTGGIDRLEARIEVVGIGWLHLPSGPRETVLQRVTLRRDRPGSRWSGAEERGYRWVDPRSGVVAEAWGPAPPAGATGFTPHTAVLLDASLEDASTLKIHVSELYGTGFFTDLTYGWDRGSGTTVPSLTNPPYANIGLLVAANTWDFSGNNSGTEVAATTTPVTSTETCNFAQCGYTVPGGMLERTDKSFNVPANLYKVNDVAEREDRAADVTIWLRSGSQNEGVSGSFGSGESRFCYTTFGGVTRTPVPLWRFSHLDAGSSDYYFVPGDHWEGGPFNCEQNTWNQVCGQSGFLDTLYTKACGTHTGKQLADVLKAGVVTLPSGHTFNALLVRNVADFCVYTGSSCLFSVAEVRTVNYLWQVPHMGTVVRLQSAQNVSDTTSYTTVAETDIHFGLFPPRSITVSGTTGTTVSLSWDPGVDTHRISDYKIYWDTDPGAGSAYAFDSVANPGQVAFAGTTATISGLTPGATYYFTVTSRSVFTDPSTGVPTTYESILYPTQVSGDPTFVYPVEVQATTPCPATAEVTGVTVNTTATPGEIQVCWNPATDSCLAGYRVLGSSTVNNDAGFSVVGTTGAASTCWTGSPAGTFFLVTTAGATGNGPWGHYGH